MPSLVAVAALLWFAADKGGFNGTTWMPATLLLGAGPITPGDIARVARELAPVALAPEARARVAAGRALVETLARGDQPIYGLTTGLGAGVDTRTERIKALAEEFKAGRRLSAASRAHVEAVIAALTAFLADPDQDTEESGVPAPAKSVLPVTLEELARRRSRYGIA